MGRLAGWAVGLDPQPWLLLAATVFMHVRQSMAHSTTPLFSPPPPSLL